MPSDIAENLSLCRSLSRRKEPRHEQHTPHARNRDRAVALFFALGGSAFAVGERLQGPTVAQQRCTNGAVRGIATVTGDPSKGIANVPDQFSGAAVLFARKFNCARGAVQVRRLEIGVYEVRFVNNAAASAVATGLGLFSATVETLAPGTFRIRVQNVGRADEDDGAFTVVAV